MVAAVVMMLFGIIILMCAWISSLLLTPPRDTVATQQSVQQQTQFVPTIEPEDSLMQAAAQPPAALSAPSAPTATTLPMTMPLLVNEEHPMEAAPNDLVLLNDYLPNSLVTVKEAGSEGSKEAADALIALFEAAQVDGLGGWQITDAYRSVETQQAIWDKTYKKYREENGMSEKKALQATQRRVATPGSSEHHTGLAFDIGVPGESFRLTEQCAWLSENCAGYGFVVRYTEEKERLTGITAEPWHIRYVGVEHARAMTQGNLCLEEYVDRLRASADAN